MDKRSHQLVAIAKLHRVKGCSLAEKRLQPKGYVLSLQPGGHQLLEGLGIWLMIGRLDPLQDLGQSLVRGLAQLLVYVLQVQLPVRPKANLLGGQGDEGDVLHGMVGLGGRRQCSQRLTFGAFHDYVMHLSGPVDEHLLEEVAELGIQGGSEVTFIDKNEEMGI